MEALGAAASITQFALLSLKCVKEVYNTLSAIKDGPAIVQLVASDFLLLQDILERLVRSSVASANPALDGHIRQCIQNVCSRAEPITKLQATPGDRSAGRFWKRLKIIVNENDLNRIRSELNQLVTILNLRLCGLSSNAIYELKDETQQIRQQMYSMGLSLNSQLDAQMADFLSIENNMSTSYRNGHKDLQASLSLIQQTIDSTSSISASDTASMLSLLNQIKYHVAPDYKSSNKATITTNGDREPTTCEPNNDVDQNMLECIDRLCSLIDEKRDAVDVYAEDDDQAESVIDDLQTMLKAVRKGHGHALDELFEKGIRRFGRSFGHGELSINSKGNENRRIVGRVIQQEMSREEADIGVGKVKLVIHKRKRTILDDGSMSTARKNHLTDYNMSLAFFPNGKHKHHMLTASITQREILAGSVSSISRLQVNRVLPTDSPVFKLVEQGRLEELRRMLQNGHASLRDHDEYGASLLFYSTRQPEMCKFLLDEGLDADHVAFKKMDGVPDRYRFTYHCLQLGSMSVDGPGVTEDNVRINACRRLLLTAGADPTYREEFGPLSFLEYIAIDAVDPEAIDLVWGSGLISHFATLQNWRLHGKSPFLIACHDFSSIFMERSRQLLLIGADIRDRTSRGDTCLHLLLDYITDLEGFDEVVFLLKQGADPHAKNLYDISVSKLVYDRRDHRDVSILGYPGDMWDAALHICGYDIAHFRSYRRRRPRYDSYYTRESFEKLWKGREDQCPYWDDKPWPPLKPGEEEEEEEEEEDQSPHWDDETWPPLKPGEEEGSIDYRPWDLTIDGNSHKFSSELDVSEDEDQLESHAQMQDEWLSSEDEEGGVSL